MGYLTDADREQLCICFLLPVEWSIAEIKQECDGHLQAAEALITRERESARNEALDEAADRIAAKQVEQSQMYATDSWLSGMGGRVTSSALSRPPDQTAAPPWQEGGAE